VIQTAVLGFARIGADRELKRALEQHWAGKLSASDLEGVARSIRRSNLTGAATAGIDILPSNDFSLYDHVLDTAVMVGAIPKRFATNGEAVDASRYFAMARGTASAPPLEMTKWLDTNYHYLVPELRGDTRFRLDARKPVGEFREALDLGIKTRPVVLGPLSFLLLAKIHEGHHEPLALLDQLLPVYAELLSELSRAGAKEVQIDEPCLVHDLTDFEISEVERSWVRMAASSSLDLVLTTYFGGLGRWLDRVLALPAAEFHLDLVRDPAQLQPAVAALQPNARLSLGVVDGRNVWITDLDAVLAEVEPVIEHLGESRVRLAPSCSLLHVPYSLDREVGINSQVRAWLAFGAEKLSELDLLKRALGMDASARIQLLATNREAILAREQSRLVHSARVARELDAVAPDHLIRRSDYTHRANEQAKVLELPELPTTTIGSFPQTPEIRDARQRARRGELDEQGYEAFLRDEIATVVHRQEEMGLDVLVHGEAERNDMVEYFAEHLSGFVVSAYGWVQSYGSRCVKPPILYGDVERPTAMTVRWWEHAQGCTSKPMKGMLTGPVTILQWSFVRDDQPRAVTCQQIALAVRSETLDLERAGAKVIQIDEPALREGLPLRVAEQDTYLRWAIDCFRLAANGVADITQLHTHMCYSEFNEILEHIARLDADVISIEASRSQMELLDAFQDFRYPNSIGPGVYDIHSPRVPSVDEIVLLIRQAEQRIPREQLWVNPDCGLKTRRWEQVTPALEHLVEAARQCRAERTGR
jgi:5-methyltetrahydropteroyltriglutamate--homocysteine methyltransferase